MNIIKNGEIVIDKRDWKSLNENHSKEEIIQLISDTIEQKGIPLPYREIELADALTDFDNLKNLDTSALIKTGKTFTKYPYKLGEANKYIDSCVIGNKSSDYFHQESRFRCDSINSPSPLRTWTIEKFRKNVLKALWTLKFEEINAKSFRQILALRNYIASQFRPSAAKAVYDYLGSIDVLDFSSGWGDRLAGFYAASKTESYFGCDPNKNLREGYTNQLNTYDAVIRKSVELHEECAEDVQFPEGYDTVFTSPPYFNIERYTQDENQSWKRYRKLDLWLNDFLFKVLEKSWKGLKPNGYLAINIADVYSNHRINNICDPMNEFISKLPKAKFQEMLGYRMMKRPQSASDKTGIYVEPIWIWKKCSG